METKWLEDFITLAQTGNFSKSAKLRHVTQPAFSRRIQALEAWLGCELIDRGVYPTRLSTQGAVFYEQALSMLEQIRQTRNIVRGGGRNAHSRAQIHVAVPHTIAFSRCPDWFEGLRTRLAMQGAQVRFKLTASNVHDAVSFFLDGGCDFLVCFYHGLEPIEFDPLLFEVRSLGDEQFRPYAASTPKREPKYRLDPLAPLPVPLLGFAKHAYLSHMMNLCLANGPLFKHEIVFETDMSECMKSMCERGAGVAWLPSSAVDQDPRSSLLPIEGPYSTAMEIRLVRRKPAVDDSSSHTATLERVWKMWPD